MPRCWSTREVTTWSIEVIDYNGGQALVFMSRDWCTLVTCLWDRRGWMVAPDPYTLGCQEIAGRWLSAAAAKALADRLEPIASEIRRRESLARTR